MKKSFFIFGAIISTLSTCFAELVPGASHILNFTDEEVEALQQAIKYKGHIEIEFYINQHNTKILEKYPLDNLNSNGQIDYVIKNEEILSYLLFIYECAYDYGYSDFSQYYFVYLLLIAIYEKIPFPDYIPENYKYYQAIAYCLKMALCFNALNIQMPFSRIHNRISNSKPDDPIILNLIFKLSVLKKHTKEQPKSLSKCCIL